MDADVFRNWRWWRSIEDASTSCCCKMCWKAQCDLLRLGIPVQPKLFDSFHAVIDMLCQHLGLRIMKFYHLTTIRSNDSQNRISAVTSRYIGCNPFCERKIKLFYSRREFFANSNSPLRLTTSMTEHSLYNIPPFPKFVFTFYYSNIIRSTQRTF
jgi:hypothetical protein